MQEILDKALRIRLVIFDVDGVLTDGSLFFLPSGEECKVFNSRDGHGMKMLRETGVEIAVITARKSKAVLHRMAGLGIKHVYQGYQDKIKAFDILLDKLGIDAAQAAYVGDDVVDLPVMRRVGLAITVKDGDPLVARYAHWQVPRRGGCGAVRDVCELIMKAQGNLDDLLSRYVAG